MDPDALEEIRNYKKCLIKYYASVDDLPGDRKGPFVPIFVEHFSPVKNLSPHPTIDVFPLTTEEFDLAKLTFKRELHGLDKEFMRTHRSLTVMEPSPRLGISEKLPRGRGFNIPPNPPYIFIDFALELGYLHFIEEDDSMASSSVDKVNRRWIKSVLSGIAGKNSLETPGEKLYDAHLDIVKANYPKCDWITATEE